MMVRLAVGLTLIVLPVLELMLLIKIGQSIGVLATVALVLGAALAGVLILSRQSLSAVNRALQALSEGRPPVEPVLDGLFLMLAGGLLLMPGFISDVLALLLLIPPLRRAVAHATMRWALRHVDLEGDAYGYEEDLRDWGRRPGARGKRPDGPIIEGEFTRLDERPAGERRDGGSGAES
jgi:UPF0716 protein FxsA